LTIALYFECRISTPSDCFFGDFAHWERVSKSNNGRDRIL